MDRSRDNFIAGDLERDIGVLGELWQTSGTAVISVHLPLSGVALAVAFDCG
jgi:hypothetical protein